MQYSTIVTTIKNDKEIVFFLREGDVFSLENIVDVEIYHVEIKSE